MKLGYTIVYVKDVPASLAFYGKAFGLATRFLHESNTYGELETGDTALAFAAHELGQGNMPDGYVACDASTLPLGFEVALVTADVGQAHRLALAAGAAELKPPQVKPWGQTVSYVRCPDGTVVELCSPVAAG